MVLADSGQAGLAAATSMLFDVAIVDLNMAEMGGIEVIQKLKKLSPRTEILMVTGFESLESVHEALRSGACDYLSKPFSVSTIRAAVGRAAQRGLLLKQLSDQESETYLLRDELVRKVLEARSSKAESEIYACILHDLRNPLCIIASLVMLIEKETLGRSSIPEETVGSLHKHVGQIQKQVERCAEVSNRYLNLLRAEHHFHGTVEVNSLLSDLKKLLLLTPSAKNNTLEIRPLSQDCIAQINSTDLLQILVNLVTNALECSSLPHQVRITASRVSSPLDYAILNSGEGQLFAKSQRFTNTPAMVAIAVEDNGPGIAPNSLSSIFEPFITSKYSSNGIGLGLAIVNRLLHESAAALHVCSTLGSGSRFTLFVPAHAPGTTLQKR